MKKKLAVLPTTHFCTPQLLPWTFKRTYSSMLATATVEHTECSVHPGVAPSLVPTSHRLFSASPLPPLWRVDRQLPSPLRLVSRCAVPDGTRAVLHAIPQLTSPDLAHRQLLLHNTAFFSHSVATFTHLRFMVSAGRYGFYALTFIVLPVAMEPLVVHVPELLRVTSDGARKPRVRTPKKSSPGDRHTPAEASQTPDIQTQAWGLSGNSRSDDCSSSQSMSPPRKRVQISHPISPSVACEVGTPPEQAFPITPLGRFQMCKLE